MDIHFLIPPTYHSCESGLSLIGKAARCAPGLLATSPILPKHSGLSFPITPPPLHGKRPARLSPRPPSAGHAPLRLSARKACPVHFCFHPTTSTRRSRSACNLPHSPKRIFLPALPVIAPVAAPGTILPPVTRRTNSARPITAPSTRYRERKRSNTCSGNLPPRFLSSQTLRASMPFLVFIFPVLASWFLPSSVFPALPSSNGKPDIHLWEAESVKPDIFGMQTCSTNPVAVWFFRLVFPLASASSERVMHALRHATVSRHCANAPPIRPGESHPRGIIT